MFGVARLGFVREIMRAHVGTYISAYQEILSSSYQKKFYSEETCKEAKGNIEEELLKNEVDNFIRFLVKKDVDFLYIINDPFRYFSIGILEEVDDEMPDFACSIDEIFDIFITFRFDHAGNIRENIAFEQAAEITENIASKIEPSDEALGFGSQDPSTIVRYLDIISEKIKLPNEAMEFINALKNNTFPSESGKFVIKDVVTANTLLDVVLSRDNHTKKLDCYKQLREIIAEILSFSCCQKGIRNFFIKLSRDGLIKLIHYKESFLKLLKSDKRFSLGQASNIILQLVDPSILDLVLSANDRSDSPQEINRNDSSQEIENFIIEANAILSNSPANVYSQTEIDNFIKEAQAKNGIVCGTLPDYVRCLKIYSIYYHSHPIFYHLLNRLIRINTLSLEQIRKFIQIIAFDTTNIVNNNIFTGREFLFNDFRNIILNQKRANFGADYIICYLLDNNIPIEEIGKLFSGLLNLYGYDMFYKLLYEEYNLLNTSVQIYCCIKNHTSLRVEEFTLPFVTQFINEIEEFDSEFWQREYIPGILKMLPATLQNASPDVTINMLMTLKSELQDCSSYKDIAEHAFALQQNSSKFWLQINKLMKSFTLSEQSLLAIKHDIRLKLAQEYSEHIDHYTSYLAKIVIESTLHIAAQQILNDNCNPKINTLVELSMRQLINNLACSSLAKIVDEQKPSHALCDVKLSGNVKRRM